MNDFNGVVITVSDVPLAGGGFMEPFQITVPFPIDGKVGDDDIGETDALEKIKSPGYLRTLPQDELQKLCKQIADQAVVARANNTNQELVPGGKYSASVKVYYPTPN